MLRSAREHLATEELQEFRRHLTVCLCMCVPVCGGGPSHLKSTIWFSTNAAIGWNYANWKQCSLHNCWLLESQLMCPNTKSLHYCSAQRSVTTIRRGRGDWHPSEVQMVTSPALECETSFNTASERATFPLVCLNWSELHSDAIKYGGLLSTWSFF